jgi:hypothetical protein
MRVKKKMTLEQKQVPLARIPDSAVPESLVEWPKEYVVKKVLGSTTPAVWSVLSKEQVDKYCDDENWEVTIT